MSDHSLRKRYLHYALEFAFFSLLLFSLVLLVKPGSAIFYKDIPVETLPVTRLKNAYSVTFQIDTGFYNVDSILVTQNGAFLTPAAQQSVNAGYPGSYAASFTTEGAVQILFCPLGGKTNDEEMGSFHILIRHALVSRTTGGIAALIFMLGFFALSLLNPATLRPQKRSLPQVLAFWAKGDAGGAIFAYLQKLADLAARILRLVIGKLKEPSFLLHQLIIPFTITGFLSLILWILSGMYLERGVTYHFLRLISFGSLALSGVFLLLLIVQVVRGKPLPRIHRQPAQKNHPLELLFLLFPLTPVVQYIVNNLEEFSVNNSLAIVGFFVSFTAVVIFILPLLAGTETSQKTVQAFGLGLVYLIANMGSMSSQFHWFETGSFVIQFALFTVIFLAIKLVPSRIVSVFFLLNFISAGVFQLFSVDLSPTIQTAAVEGNDLRQMVRDSGVTNTPNVYLFMYDAYVANETMLQYGIDNSAQEAFLSENGFTLYPGAYSLGAKTAESMSYMLNTSLEINHYIRQAISGDSEVHHIFDDLGYLNWGLFPNDFMFRGTVSKYDLSTPAALSSNHLLEAILMGEFRFDVGFQDWSHEAYRKEKIRLVSTLPDRPVFIYSHTNYPSHAQNSGGCRENETDLYAERLQVANQEMKEDVSAILENDPTAIVIVAGDHGPYLTKNCAGLSEEYDISEITRFDIQDRFGVFLAIRWPTPGYQEYDQITILQDIFPAVFAYLTQDAEMLSARIPVTRTIRDMLSGAYVEDGIIHGGANDGEPLFLSAEN